ncbi:MAG TPA: glutamyl-tRNA reductase, partial [Planctomycetota bacterium]|nr:glutamyl-tRNA reductase [Planctomycetota bacterium]
SMQPTIGTTTLRDIAQLAQSQTNGGAAPALSHPHGAAGTHAHGHTHADAATHAPAAGRCPFGHGGLDAPAAVAAAPAVATNSPSESSAAMAALAQMHFGPAVHSHTMPIPGMSHPTFVDRFLLVGLTHRKGESLWLERMAVPHDELPGVLTALKAQPGIAQAMVLSTCNRTELYVLVEELALPQAVFIAMDKVRPAWGDVPAEQLDIQKGWAAVEHLFAVTSGLEAMILGETEITAQVKIALELAQKTEAAGPELVGLVQQALRATKKVRNNTRVHTGTFSVGSAAAHLALAAQEAHATHGSHGPIVVIGAGAIGDQVARSLQRANCRDFVVINRNVEKARALVQKYGGRAAGLEALYPTVAGASVVIAAVSVAEPVVTAEHFDKHARADASYTFIDLCIPRAIDHRLGEHPKRNVLGLPAVRKHLDEHIAMRTLDEPLARQIVAEEVRRYRGRILSQFLVPLIKTMQERADQIATSRLSRYTADHGASPAVEKWAQGLKGELLDMFLGAMRDAMVSGNCPLSSNEEDKHEGPGE